MKATISARVQPEVRDALERAAQADTRPLGTLIDKILTEWTRANLGVRLPVMPRSTDVVDA